LLKESKGFSTVLILVKTEGFGRKPSLIMLKIETLRSLLYPIRVNTNERFSSGDDCSLSNTEEFGFA